MLAHLVASSEFLLRNRAPKRFAADNARGMNAVDKAMLRRLKKQWHAEWEAARQQQEDEDENAILDALDAKIEAMREREEEAARLLALEDLRDEGESEAKKGKLDNVPSPLESSRLGIMQL